MQFPNESAAYRDARNNLLAQELGLRRAIEAVAVARRALPPGGAVPEDYVFEGSDANGKPVPVRMSELFADGKDTLMIYNFMYSPTMESPCPMCSAYIDSMDGVWKHIDKRVNFVIVAKSPLKRILATAEERGWDHLPFLSSGGNNYNSDYFGETLNGDQDPMMNVFLRSHGSIYHTWGCELFHEPTDPGQDPRHAGTTDMLWNLLDNTPDGRGTDWYPALSN